jgi:putative acetyltransferase
VTISDGSENWYGLGPISVLPKHQRQGIGKALIREGVSRLRDLGAQGCCLVGDPAYYERFGFRGFLGLTYDGILTEYVMALSLVGNTPQGTITFHEAFWASG